MKNIKKWLKNLNQTKKLIELKHEIRFPVIVFENEYKQKQVINSMIFSVFYDKSEVQFLINTNWYQKEDYKTLIEYIKLDIITGKDYSLISSRFRPTPFEVCYYSPKKINEEDIYFENGSIYAKYGNLPYYYNYESFTKENNNNIYLTDHLYNLLITEGDKSVWKYLENYYRETFDKNI